MIEVRRHIPTVCYVETDYPLFPSVERPNIVPMPHVCMEYAVGLERSNTHWANELGKIRDEWHRQGLHDRYAFRFRLFNDKRWPPKTQRNFSDYLAAFLPYILRTLGQDKIDFIYADCEDTNRDGIRGTPDDEQPYYTPQELRAAFGKLGKVARTYGNWNNAEGMGWWRRLFPGAVKAAIPQAYECTDEDSFARIVDAISFGPADCIPWLPCYCRQDEHGRWPMVDEETSIQYTRRLIFNAVSQGVTRFGLFLHPFSQGRGESYAITNRGHRYLDAVNDAIDEANRLFGRDE